MSVVYVLPKGLVKRDAILPKFVTNILNTLDHSEKNRNSVTMVSFTLAKRAYSIITYFE